MRPGQNKRMRGRNNSGGGNRKGPNPLTRSYESNGPDVKIRGTAQHVGEKYLQLARDAQTSGDPVAAENYLQHAEHYFRIIAAAHQAQQQAQVGYVRQAGEVDAEEIDDDDLVMPDRFASPAERIVTPPVPQQQPYPERAGFNGDRPSGQDRYERQDRPDNQDRPYRPERQDRQDRQNQDRSGQDRDPRQERSAQDRAGQDRNPYDRDRAQRTDRIDRIDRPDRGINRGPRYPREGQEFREPRDNRDGRERDARGGREPREFRENRDIQFRDQPRLPIAAQEPAADTRPAVQPEVDTGQDLPAFITAPVRVVPAATPEPTSAPTSAPAEAPAQAPEPVRAAVAAPPAEAVTPSDAADASSETFAVRPRRRRRTRAVAGAEGEASTEASGEPSSE